MQQRGRFFFFFVLKGKGLFHNLIFFSPSLSLLSLGFSEKYFDMKKNQCKDALDIYKKFLYRMTKLSEFLKVAEVQLAILCMC